jgi:hypothetical protein
MIRQGRAWVAAVCLLLAGSAASAQSVNYDISNYELTVDLSRGDNLARVTMDVTYRIHSGTKSDGFKYIGRLEPSALQGVEADGTPMVMSIEHQRETMIRWRFRKTGPGEARVRVSFQVPAALFGTEQSTFEAPWAGVFRVPIHRAVYRFVPPSDWTEESLSVKPSAFVRSTLDGHPAIEVEQRPLIERTFVVTMRPAIVPAVEAASRPISAPTTSRRQTGRGPSGPMLLAFVMVGLIIYVMSRAKRGKRGVSDGYASGCAGGSSCSSSCGGGGCGGGCGG